MKAKVIFHLAWIIFVVIVTAKENHAITINIEYSTDFGGDESPSWDANGTILTAHFQAAKQIWETLLPGDGTYSFDFQWDDDIGVNTLGLTTDNAFDTFIEINPIQPWYADPTPLVSEEFSFSDYVNTMGVPVYHQRFYSQLSSSDQSTYFPGSAPPGALEVMYRGFGSTSFPSASGQAGVNASTGYDLLSTIVHEIGHVLGIAGTEPGEYNIFPQHVGGISNVLVLEGDGGHLAGNATVPGFLMCDSCGSLGVRRVPTATDILVIAEDQGITDVHLARVGSITGGPWHTASNWIGGDIPDITQDAYILHGGTVTLGADAAAKDITVGSNSSLILGDRILSSTGTFNFAGSTTVSIDAGGILYANQIVRGNNDLITAAGSRVAFNSYSGGGNAPVTFGGSVSIGTGSAPPPEITFDPATIPTWTIGGELAVGVFRSAHFVIDNAMDVTSATGEIGSGSSTLAGGDVTVDGSGSSWGVSGALRVGNGTLSVSNSGQVQSAFADLGTGNGIGNVDINAGHWDVSGNIEIGPTNSSSPGGGDINIRNLGSLRADGNLVLRGNPIRSSNITLYSRGNVEVDGTVFVHPYGKINLRDDSYLHSGALGSETFENLGGNNSDPVGGIIQFLDSSTSGNAHISNRPGNATFAGGAETRFYGNSKAGSLLTSGKTRIDNYPGTASIFGGATRFFGHSSGGDSDFYNHPGPGNAALIEFNDDSTGGFGTYTNLPGVLGQSLGGTVIFNDRSKAGSGIYTSQGEGGNVVFNDFASADNGNFSTAGNIGGNSTIRFNENSTAANGTFSLGTNTSILFFQNSTAGDAEITLLPHSHTSFSGDFNLPGNPTTTAGNANIFAQGAGVFGQFGGTVDFSTWSTAGNAVINAYGGTVSGAGGATISFDYSGSAGNATLLAHGGVPGSGGGQIYFRRGGNGPLASVVNNAGGYVDLGGNRIYGGTDLGSIEGAGTFALNGSELRTGGLNLSTTVLGTIIDALGTNPNGKLTKVGTGTLTLAGLNTYSGDTTISGGTLSIQNPYLSNTADVRIATGATFNLNFIGTDVIDSLFIGGISRPVGTHGSLSSIADFKWPELTGTGLLMVSHFEGLAGDFDGDGKVDGRDFLVWQRGGSPNPLSSSDLNAWKANYGAPLTAVTSAVPEPGGLFLLSSVFIWQAVRRGAIRASGTGLQSCVNQSLQQVEQDSMNVVT